jgi:1-aminocyclopropane-1-carboxylate deaminase/D-cysteine desulfhydrase-like pyridoxal-dependent ACC family enzyme
MKTGADVHFSAGECEVASADMTAASDAPGLKAATVASESALQALLERPPNRLPWSCRPTPVERAAWLDVGSAEVWLKRDDRSSAIYGGGKVRKLEWILANPPYDESGPIVSVGGIGSHHLLALGLFLREQGRTLHALTFDQLLTEHVRTNLAVLVSIGTRIWDARSRTTLPLAYLAYYGWRRPPELGRYMAAGASTSLGCFGFVEAGLELAAQLASNELPTPRTIYVTAGSAGASAGLALGLGLANVSTHLHLVSSVEPLLFNRFLFRRKMDAAWGLLRRCGVDQSVRTPEELLRHAGVTWSVDHGQVGGGYGVPTHDARAAVELGATHGLRLETTYTAKCLAALRRAEDAWPRGGPVLFWNTHAGNDLRSRIDPDWEDRCPIDLARLPTPPEERA